MLRVRTVDSHPATTVQLLPSIKLAQRSMTVQNLENSNALPPNGVKDAVFLTALSDTVFPLVDTHTGA